MKFGRIAVAAGEGAILAHSIKAPSLHLRKGEVIRAAHIAALETAGIEAIVGALLEPGDIAEDAAAARLARHIAGPGIRMEKPFTGRCNMMAEADGLMLVDRAAIDAVNAVDESITVATLAPMRPVVAGEMVATVKIIPFAVPGSALARCMAAAAPAAVRVAPFLPLRIGVVSTVLPGLKPATIAKTIRVLQARLDRAGATIAADLRVDHDVAPLAAAIRGLAGQVGASEIGAGRVDCLVVFGASAITDRRDVVPVAIERAGGSVEHLGMPVDPGNLLLLGRIGVDGRQPIPVIGAPGCARSPKENGFDFVLWRLLAGLAVSVADLRGMGVGGLLSEIVSRPQLRQPGDE